MTRSRTWRIIAFAPVLVILYANFMFVRNHFYVHGPYLLDAGWFSDTVFHAGIIPRNPGTFYPMVYYWGWHVSLIVSLGSILSYAFPGDRVEWYCIFQALIFAPLAFAMPILVPPAARASIRSALLVASCTLAFAFCGQVISCLGYPHFEIFAACGLAIMLAGLAAGRQRIAWIGLTMSIATREDCGFHAATFLAAALASDLLGRPFPVARRRVLLMLAVGLVSTCAMMALQKKCFVSVDAFTIYISGLPRYAHLTAPFMAHRLATFGSKCGFIWMPMIATVVVALARRDARYLLGWVFGLPWLVLNLTAYQEVKGEIAIYTGFPFVGSIFWTGAYALVVESRSEESRRRWALPLVLAALVSVASTAGVVYSFPVSTKLQLTDAIVPSTENPAGLRAFARAIRGRELGALRVDHAIASWGIETLKVEDLLTDEENANGIVKGDAFSFFASPEALQILVRSPFPKCGRVPETRAFVCVRDSGTLPSTVVSSSPWILFASLAPDHVRHEAEVIVGDAQTVPGAAVYGPFVHLQPGSYEVTWDVALERCETMDCGLPHVDVLLGGTHVLGIRDLVLGQANATLRFDVTEASRDQILEFRIWSGRCGFVLRAINVRRVDR